MEFVCFSLGASNLRCGGNCRFVASKSFSKKIANSNCCPHLGLGLTAACFASARLVFRVSHNDWISHGRSKLSAKANRKCSEILETAVFDCLNLSELQKVLVLREVGRDETQEPTTGHDPLQACSCA